MTFAETETTELKQKFSDSLPKEIVAFLNTDSGTIPFAFELESEPKSEPQRDSKIREKIINEIKKNPKITKEELSKKFELSLSTIKRKLSEMKDIVYFEGASKSGHWVVKDNE